MNFNIHDICYTEAPGSFQAYVQYIDEEYDTEHLTQILTGITDIIGTNILNTARQGYDPQSANVTILISEQPVTPTDSQIEESPGPLSDTILVHLGRGYIVVYTYPEIHPVDDITTFHIDIDVPTYGVISPLKAPNHLIYQFDSDIITVDYRVHDFTRNIEERKYFIDRETDPIQNCPSGNTREAYQMTDVSVYQGNLSHTKMLLKNSELENYLFGNTTQTLSTEQHEQVMEQLKHEMLEIFYTRNMPR